MNLDGKVINLFNANIHLPQFMKHNFVQHLYIIASYYIYLITS